MYQLPGSISVPFAAPKRGGDIDGWHYNYLKVVTSPTSATAPVGGSVMLTYYGPVVQSGAAVSYQWYQNGSPVGTNSRTYTGSLANNHVVTTGRTCSLYVKNTLTLCG